jgi:hypothetical protein
MSQIELVRIPLLSMLSNCPFGAINCFNPGPDRELWLLKARLIQLFGQQLPLAIDAESGWGRAIAQGAMGLQKKVQNGSQQLYHEIFSREADRNLP